ncbi:MAG TPA: PEP-CTERM-box response regulator transcription factor [Sphingobium sp.]|nr:PEP-CTERM-box response regulator transcription factor [Sphingobium sp.]
MSDTRPKLLIVEDDPGLQRQLRWAYEEYQLFIAGDREEAIEMLRAEAPDVVTLDLGLPPDPDGTSEGFATLAEILRIKPDTKIIVASGHGARESALNAISGGAYDFYHKPVDIDELGLIVRRAFHVHALEKENARLAEVAPEEARVLGRLITTAPEMTKVARTIERVATAQVSVMLLGASGTGKELLAQALHDASPRRDGAFVAINCAAIPEALLDAELFGHEAPGKIELAQGGSLFLDEVGDISLALQVKLLRFLQERRIDGIGGREAIQVDTRILCATHQNLEEMIAAGTFREDLYYRLAEIVVRIPALKDRPGDPALLARHFLNRFAKEMNPQVKGLAPDALAALDAWSWPGNVRELENRMKRAIIMADGKLVTAADLDLDGDRVGGSEVVNLKAAREMADRRAIRRAIARTDGNISGAAKMLGISRPTLYDLLKQYQMQN